MKKLIVLIPAYNEAERIGETVRQVRALAPRLEGVGYGLQIYVINDGSSDRTAVLATEASADRVLRHPVNRGLGAAVRTGLTAARAADADIAVKFDADLQHDPGDILELIGPILRDEAELVYGDRFQRIEYRMPAVRRWGNRAFTGLMRWMTRWPLRDSQPGIFAADATYLRVFHLPGDYNYTQQILVDAYHKGMRFAHVPVAFRSRTTGRSFISMRYPFKVLPQILMVLVGVRPMRIFVPIGSLFLLIGVCVAAYQLATWFAGHTSKPIESVNLVLGSTLFGLQTLFFGILAQLVVDRR